ncbi:MAG: hypothetical protein ACLP0J_21755 [Solirubrobacteraceae bacterium]
MALAAALGVGACGGGSETGGAAGTGGQGAGGRGAAFPVQVVTASFPGAQRVAQIVHLEIAVRNIGSATLPNLAVTITDPPFGTSAQAFSALIPAEPGLASRSRPIWIIDRPPGPCGYSCRSGGSGGAVTAFSNTWALGALAPGATAIFDWTLTPVQPGGYTVAYRLAAALDGSARAVLPGGLPAAGRFEVRVSSQPRNEHVNDNGRVVYSP